MGRARRRNVGVLSPGADTGGPKTYRLARRQVSRGRTPGEIKATAKPVGDLGRLSSGRGVRFPSVSTITSIQPSLPAGSTDHSPVRRLVRNRALRSWQGLGERYGCGIAPICCMRDIMSKYWRLSLILSPSNSNTQAAGGGWRLPEAGS